MASFAAGHPRGDVLERAQVFGSDLGTLYKGDCLELLPAVPDATVDLWFADPPFNLGKDYGSGVSDSLGEQEYLAWTEAWLLEGVRLLKPGGALFVFNLPRWNIEAGHILTNAGLLFRHWIAIDIKYSLPIPGRLYPSHYSLLYYTKGRPARFTRPRIAVPRCRHCGGDIKDYGGHRDKLHPDGLNLSDVWYDIPPVRHRTTKRRSANELSEKLLMRVLEIASRPGDLILDPFGGSGTTYAVAERMHRHWIGMELGDCDPIVRRLTGRQADILPPNRGDAGKSRRARPEPRVLSLFDP
ncbi:MAG: site-specific DNA-methyltransferase [Candidatus Dormibacteraeota bacterium]|nr:site-specific DNA-methyltransferase [Candidatus Dormibacteraeota bacterium]